MNARVQLSHRGKPLGQLEVAETLWARTKGLLGRTELAPKQGLWIKRTNSVHTFFMRFAIDLVFVDRSLRVRKTYQNVGPGRLIWPVWSASSVIELPAGFLDQHPFKKGEQLHVDRTLS